MLSRLTHVDLSLRLSDGVNLQDGNIPLCSSGLRSGAWKLLFLVIEYDQRAFKALLLTQFIEAKDVAGPMLVHGEVSHETRVVGALLVNPACVYMHVGGTTVACSR